MSFGRRIFERSSSLRTRSVRRKGKENRNRKRGCKKPACFTAPQNAGGDPGILDGIVVGFALHFAEIPVDLAAKGRLKAVKAM